MPTDQSMVKSMRARKLLKTEIFVLATHLKLNLPSVSTLQPLKRER